MADTGVVGIDFGTTTTLAAERTPVGPDFHPLGRTTYWLPTVVALDDAGQLVVGEDAEVVERARGARRSVKQLITRSEQLVHLPEPQGATRAIPVTDAVAAVLREAWTRVSRQVRAVGPSQVVLACPAMWDHAQREQLRKAAGLAGLPLEDGIFLDEPVAAGLGWLQSRPLTDLPRGSYLVVDVGGGTTDIALLKVGVEAGRLRVDVGNADGRERAGDDVDRQLADRLRPQVMNGHSHLSSQERGLLQHALRQAARRLKEQLSFAERASELVDLGTRAIDVEYDRRSLEELLEEQLNQTVELAAAVVRGALMKENASASPDRLRRLELDEIGEHVDHLLVVGGMARTPLVVEYLTKAFPGATLLDTSQLEVDQYVAAGLGEPRLFDSLNLHRPSFDIVIEYVDVQGRRASETLFAAHDALYSRDSVSRGESLLGHRRELTRPADLRGTVVGRLRARMGDRVVPFRIGAEGSVEESHAIEIDDHPGVFKLYVDGTILIRDSLGREFRVKPEGWPLQPDERLGVLVEISKEWDRPYWDTK